jgi:hypothetical protein
VLAQTTSDFQAAGSLLAIAAVAVAVAWLVFPFVAAYWLKRIAAAQAETNAILRRLETATKTPERPHVQPDTSPVKPIGAGTERAPVYRI